MNKIIITCMNIIMHLAVLLPTCLFGFHSSDRFELLVAGLLLFAVATLISNHEDLWNRIMIVEWRILKLEQPHDKEMIGLFEDAMKSGARPGIHSFTVSFFAVASVAILCKSIFY